MDFVKLKEKEFNVEIDDNLLRHLGFLYLRDPLVIFKGESKDHQMSTSDFEVTNKEKLKKFLFRIFKVQTGILSDLSHLLI